MNSSDGKSAAPPLRKRKSKRFDRSGSNQQAAGLAGADEVSGTSNPTVDSAGRAGQAGADAPLPPEADTLVGASSEASDKGHQPVAAPPFVPTANQRRAQPKVAAAPLVADAAVRSQTLDERQACGRCGHELSMVNIEVDENVLIMESCDNCDARRWHIAGEPIDLQQVLDHVGEHTGRRR